MPDEGCRQSRGRRYPYHRCCRTLATPILAIRGAREMGRERLPAPCCEEIVRLRGTDRSAMRRCLRKEAGELSDTCRSALMERVQAAGGREDRMGGRRGGEGRRGGAMPAPQTLAYRAGSLQTLDLWVRAGAKAAPLVRYVHSGGWKRGSKNKAASRAMPAHMMAQNYAFASIDYRLVARNTVEEQAGDVAAALADVLKRADALGIDRRRVVLTGHSAGAHLAALVGTDELYLKSAGLSFADTGGPLPILAG